jgi:hypothetical protein
LAVKPGGLISFHLSAVLGPKKHELVSQILGREPGKQSLHTTEPGADCIMADQDDDAPVRTPGQGTIRLRPVREVLVIFVPSDHGPRMAVLRDYVRLARPVQCFQDLPQSLA